MTLRAEAEVLCEYFIAKDTNGVAQVRRKHAAERGALLSRGYGPLQGLPEELVEAVTRRLHNLMSLLEVSSEGLISHFDNAPVTDVLKPVTQLNIARVLIHRPDDAARRWVRERAKSLTELLARHERTNVHADELLPADYLDLITRHSETESSRGTPRKPPVPKREDSTAADLAASVNGLFATGGVQFAQM